MTERKTSAATQENTKIFLGENKGENPAKLPQYRIRPRQCKTLATRIVSHLPQYALALSLSPTENFSVGCV